MNTEKTNGKPVETVPENTYLTKATNKRLAYVNAGYTCTKIEDTGTSASFVATDAYGVSRTHIFGDTQAETTPILEKAKANIKRKSKKVK